MANHVAGDVYYELDGQLMEIKRQLRQQSGYPFDLERLKIGLQSLIEGRFLEPIDTFLRDMRKEGWTLLENSPRRPISVTDLDLVPFLRNGESNIEGEEMLRRARTDLNANYGQEDAEFLLEHQAEIPVEFRKFYLVFPATVWRGSGGGRDVSYLYWDGGRWFLDFGWLGSVWRSGCRLVRPRK